MKTKFIPINSTLFEQTFNYPIDEIKFVIGGICAIESEKLIGSAIVYKNPHIKTPENTILFGYFNADNKNTANALIQELEKVTISNGASTLVGPINGSTWYNHRLMDSFENNPFLGEEVTPLEYNDYLTSNNFKVLKSYQSNLASSSHFSDEFITQKEKELNDNDWKIRTIDKAILTNELLKIARFSNKAFSSNFLFSPIEELDFVKKYTPLMTSLNTEYVWLIENQEGETKALMLAYENLLNNNKELIIKTTARNPICDIKGLGMYLCHKVTKQAKENGIDNIIHAYIANENNSSASISQSQLQGDMHRTYKIYCKETN
jgi:hypothetical protein